MFGNVSISSMRPVSPGQSIAQRSLTPSKIPSLLLPSSANRNSTPTARASSNPRTDSASRRVGKVVGIENEVNTAIARSASRRKQRRWENMNMFGMEIHHILATEELIDMGKISPEFLFQVESKSAFQELFLPKNQHILEAFRSCEYVPSSIVKNHTPKHFSTADVAWLKIENRLRPILTQALTKDPQLGQLLFCLEQAIFAFASQSSLHLVNMLIKSKAPQYFVSECVVDADTQRLHIQLVDSAHYRLLLHGICQFYGLNSKSQVQATDASKITFITLPRKQAHSPVLQEHISFVSHLLTKVKQVTSGQEEELVGLSKEMARMKVVEAKEEKEEFVMVQPGDVILDLSSSSTTTTTVEVM